MRQLVGWLACGLFAMLLLPAVAYADQEDWGVTTTTKGEREIAAELRKKTREQQSPLKPDTGIRATRGSPKDRPRVNSTHIKVKAPTAAEVKAHQEALRRYAAALAACHNELTLYGATGVTAADCVRRAGPAPRPAPGPPPGKPNARNAAEAPPPPDPGVLAQVAVTRLRIPDPVIKIGPPPEINEWQRAFVGYPLWLWTEEGSRLTQSVSLDGVTLALSARRVGTRFDMGEPGGVPVVCAAGSKWTRAVTPGAVSPTCGYRYTRPSVTAAAPDGVFTVTATTRWEVTWTALGQSGVIPLQAVARSPLQVGELQTVRRR